MVMGLPTLGGGFVGGDDHRLALNHVLVNHPSFKHAVELFTISHRDLYQPLPLLTFQLEFAITRLLGLYDRGPAAFAWLFHLTNILLHALNSVLVYLLIARLHARVAPATPRPPGEGRGTSVWDAPGAAVTVATLTALWYAIHPLQTEVVAWTNGRMMLLATLFSLLSLLSFARWLDENRAVWGVFAVFCAFLSGISKVRIELPLLFAMLAILWQARIDWRLIGIGGGVLALTIVSALVNAWSTAEADLFEEAAEHLRGPRLVRVLLAMAWYFQHYVIPIGLASYYPTPPLVRWSDPDTWWAVVIVVGVLAVLAILCVRSRVTRLGLLWFFSGIFVTLPFVPARNVLAADRYMYLPILGLLWFSSALGYSLYQHLKARVPNVRSVVTVAGLVVIPVLIGICWKTAWYYATPLRKTQRVVELFPDVPRIWEKYGWSFHSLGEYEKGIECARRELDHDAPTVRSGGLQLLGFCQLHLGRAEEALKSLHEAVVADPESSLAKYRLGMAYDELQRFDEAALWYQKAVEAAPNHNPTLNKLGAVYRRLGRSPDARRAYELAVANNPYEVPAILALAELDIAEGTRDSFERAESRLNELLGWMPENTVARTNLGAARVALHRTREGIEAYHEVLRREPGNVTALLNLAKIHESRGEDREAAIFYERAARAGLASTNELGAVVDYFCFHERAELAVQTALSFVQRFPDRDEGKVLLAWARAVSGDTARSRAEADAVVVHEVCEAMALVTRVYSLFAENKFDDAFRLVRKMPWRQGKNNAEAGRRLLRMLELYAAGRPDQPWPYCIAAALLHRDHQRQAARLSAELCEQRCQDDVCRGQVEQLKGQKPDGDVITDP